MKYRVWHKGKWVFFTIGKILTRQQREIINEAVRNGDPIQPSIGIKDRNKKEVYEGDIVLYCDVRPEYLVAREKSNFVIKYQGRTIVYNINPNKITVVESTHERKIKGLCVKCAETISK